MRKYAGLMLALVFAGHGMAETTRGVFVIPNFHPASCGWLANWSVERNYCANTYLDHLDRVRDDANYNFALSECNNMIAILNFAPERFTELKQRVKEGRVELCNAFFLEPTINLSGGEALVKSGIEGLRWQQAILGTRPRLAWMIDVTGTHEQMAQITAGLGLDALVYCRHNPTGSTLHWTESPDGTRALTLSPGHYLEWRPMFSAKEPLAEKPLLQLADDIRTRIEPLPPEKDRLRPDAGDLKSVPRRTPAGAPVLIFGGSGDYSFAPLCKSYPTQFLADFKKVAPQYSVRFATPSQYLDAIQPGLKSGAIQLPTMRGGTAFSYASFWIQSPHVKQTYRRCEQNLQAAEMLATIASLKTDFSYPVQPLYHAWLQMLLNMDRNTLWGAAGGMVFESDTSWDVRDRFEWVEKQSANITAEALRKLTGSGDWIVFFNPLNWQRSDYPELSAYSTGCPPVNLGKLIALPDTIETKFYRARLDTNTGALVSLKLKSSGREMLGGPANVIVAEKAKKQRGDPGDHMDDRNGRETVVTSSQFKPVIRATAGELATTVEITSKFEGGGQLRRVVQFNNDYPRVDFETELNDVPDRRVVVAEFPLADDITEVRRGVPYGFSHGAWSKPNPTLHGWTKGIVPAVRWSHYTLANGAGVALLDRGVTGRELVGRTPLLFLLNTTEKYRGYPTPWLSGKGKHRLEYALVAHDTPWERARIPQMAWEFSCPPVPARSGGCAPVKLESFLKTSDNVIVEALRRDGADIELRLAECLGIAGNAEVTLNLPHESAALTDLVGGHPQNLDGGPTYKFPVRPQQIVTLRFRTAKPVPEIKPLTEWDELVPAQKLPALREYLKDVKGHPPHGK